MFLRDFLGYIATFQSLSPTNSLLARPCRLCLSSYCMRDKTALLGFTFQDFNNPRRNFSQTILHSTNFHKNFSVVPGIFPFNWACRYLIYMVLICSTLKINIWTHWWTKCIWYLLGIFGSSQRGPCSPKMRALVQSDPIQKYIGGEIYLIMSC